jgi:integrase
MAEGGAAMTRRKTMTDKVEQYLAYRRDLGYATRTHRSYLRQFGAYAESIRHRGPLTVALAVQWARLPADRSPRCWAERLKMVRCFARYLAIDEPRTQIPPVHLLGPGHQRQTPHIYSEAEVSALITAARRLQPLDGLKPWSYATLIGLLACTGLRISEATQLAQSDFDERQGILIIRETKFHKSRVVPLHSSATKALRSYVRKRDQLVPFALTDRLFITDRGRPLNNTTVQGDFRKLCDSLPMVRKSSGRQPRLHDLRHTFACRRLQRWYETGTDVAHAIAALAVYLGHAEVSYTYWYLTATPELLNRAADRFQPPASCVDEEVQP